MSIEIAQTTLQKLQQRELIPSHKKGIEVDIPRWEHDSKFREKQEGLGIKKPTREGIILQDIRNRILELYNVGKEDAGPQELSSILSEILSAINGWLDDEGLSANKAEISELLAKVAVAWGIQRPDRT